MLDARARAPRGERATSYVISTRRSATATSASPSRRAAAPSGRSRGADRPPPSRGAARSRQAFATANPSTFAALVGGGLLAAAKAVDEAEEVDRDAAVTIARAVADSIKTRGKAELGDKTVLDALVPSVEALERADGDDRAALGAMVEAARRGVEETAASESRRGRARGFRSGAPAASIRGDRVRALPGVAGRVERRATRVSALVLSGNCAAGRLTPGPMKRLRLAAHPPS